MVHTAHLASRISPYLQMPHPCSAAHSANSLIPRAYHTPIQKLSLTAQVNEKNYSKRIAYSKQHTICTSCVRGPLSGTVLYYPHVYTGPGLTGFPPGSQFPWLSGSLAVGCDRFPHACLCCSTLSFPETGAKSGMLLSTAVTMSNPASAGILSVMGTSLPHEAAHTIITASC